jgi:hypothetical protein
MNIQCHNPIVRVQKGYKNSGSVVIKRPEAFTLNSLIDVNTSGKQDKYTLIYDQATNTWLAQPIEDVEVVLLAIDGGWY